MSKSEKRHFKLFTSKNELQTGKDYLRLFDAIEAQKSYDESAILKKFKDEPYFTQLRSVKLYLYRQLIKSLKNLHDQTSSRILLENYLIEIEILFQKQLYKSCARVIKQAKAYAHKYENFTKTLDLIRWEAKVAMFINDVEQIEALRVGWIKEEKEALENCLEINELRKLNYELQSFFLRKGFAKTKEELKTIRQFLSSDLLATEKKSFHAETARLSMEGNCLAILGQVSDRYRRLKKMTSLLDIHPHQIEENLNEYLVNLSILVSLSIQEEDFIFAADLIAKIDALCDSKQQLVHFSNQVSHHRTKTFFLLIKGEFKQALSEVLFLEKLIQENNSTLDPVYELLIDLQRAVVFFANQNYAKAQQFVQKIITADANVRLDIQTTARVIYLILQYETKEFHHLEYAWRATYRYFLKKKRLQEPEGVLLDFIKQTRQLNSNTEILQALANLKEKIIALNDSQFMSGFPINEWIDSKIQNRSLEEIMKANYLRHTQKG